MAPYMLRLNTSLLLPLLSPVRVLYGILGDHVLFCVCTVHITKANPSLLYSVGDNFVFFDFFDIYLEHLNDLELHRSHLWDFNRNTVLRRRSKEILLLLRSASERGERRKPKCRRLK